MFKKIAFTGLGIALLASPLFASAQSSDVQAQIQALLAQVAQLQAQLTQLLAAQGGSTSSGAPAANVQAAPSGGVMITDNVGPGDTDVTSGGAVSALQKFLASQYSNFTSDYVTGYFGPTTLAAVKQWQSEHGIVGSGTPDTTGFGFVGPKTRAAMAGNNSNGSYAGDTVTQSVPMPAPTIAPTPATPWVGGCTTNCGTPSANFSASPTSGSAPLRVVFEAYAAAAQYRNANVLSVDFGDGSSSVLTTELGCPSGDNYACRAHTYASAGTYTATLTWTRPVGCEGEDQSGCRSNVPIGTVTITVTSPQVFAPVATLDTLPSTGLSDGRLIRYKITASPQATYWLYNTTFDIRPVTDTNARVNLYVYTDPSYANPVPSLPAGGVFASTGLMGYSAFYFVNTTKMPIPASATYYFEARAVGANNSIASSPSITTTLTNFDDGSGGRPQAPNLAQMRTNSTSVATLSVAAGQQPANTLAPQGTIVPFTTFKLTNTGSVPVSIASFVVNNAGMIADGAFHGVRVDINGMPYEVDNSVFNASHQAVVLTPGLTIQAGQNTGGTISGLMATDLSAYAGQAGRLDLGGITTSVPVSGSLPISGATQTVNASLDACSSPSLYYTYGYKCWTTTGGNNSGFSASPQSGTAPLTTTFSASVDTCTYYNIDYGDGQVVALESVLPLPHMTSGCYSVPASWPHTYSSAGTYTASLIQRGPPDHSVGTATITVTNVPQVQPAISASPTSVASGGSVKFSFAFPQNTNYAVLGLSCNVAVNTGTPDRCGTTTNVLSNTDYTLPFYNTSSSAQQVTSSYCIGTSDGVYHPCVQGPTLTVGGTTQTNPTFSAWPTSGTAPLAVQFTAGNLGSDTSPYSVNFGDGSTGSGSCSPGPGLGACIQGGLYFNHTYTAVGTYTAILMYQPPAPACNAPPGAACTTVMPTPQAVGTATITLSAQSMGSVSSSGTNPNLANALSALQAALQSLLGTLGR